MSQIEYTIVRSKRRISNTTITIGAKGVIVHAPFWMPVWVINNFVEEKKDWIVNHLQKHPIQTRKDKQYLEGDQIYYLGQKLTLKINEVGIPGRTKILLSEEHLIMTVSMHFVGDKRTEEIKKSLSRWYMEKGIEHITEKVNKFSEILNVDYAKITLKNVSSIWGSCSAKNNLNFNRSLIMAPREIIDYVVIHEVCHLIHRDHSSRFWALVRSLDPDYKKHRLWLRENRFLLSF